MDKVLIVDDNQQILSKMNAVLIKYKDEFEVITANNGEKAIQVLKETHIDLVITDLVMPQTDGLTLLAYINERYPHVLCIAMTGYSIENIISMLPDNLLQLIQKPFKIYELIGIVRKSLSLKPPAGTVYGISISSFLQLIEIEEKTCALEVALINNKKGTFLFKGGVLYEALYEDMTGEEAAIEIIQNGEKSVFTLKSLPKQDISRRIHIGIMELVLKTSWRSDMNAFHASESIVSQPAEIGKTLS